MYLARLRLNVSRPAVLWSANPYRVHQRLALACGDDPRLLFRIEDTPEGTQVLVQSHEDGNWEAAFADFPILRGPVDHKPLHLSLQGGKPYRFRLLANPTAKKTTSEEGEKKKKRIGLMNEPDQIAWLSRKLQAGGAHLLGCTAQSHGLVRCKKNPVKDEQLQTHFAVLFEGVLIADDPVRLQETMMQGIGSAKAYGFGLLSLAPA